MSAEPTSEERTEEFVTLLTSVQDALYRYVLSLVAGQHDRARDLLQETNLLIWRKASDFKLGTNFEAWARRIAHFCVLADFRDKQRKPLLFGEELLTTLASEYDEHAGGAAERRRRLDDCLTKLPGSQKSAVRRRYVDGMSVSEIASQDGRSVSAISALLYRIRLALLDCVSRKAMQ